MLNNIGNVRLDNLGEFRSRELSSRNYLLVRTHHLEYVHEQLTPVGQLAVPSQSMASKNLLVLLGKIRNNIGSSVGELITSRLDSLPLLSVLRDELTKLLNIVSELGVGGITEIAVIDGTAEVLETSGLR